MTIEAHLDTLYKKHQQLKDEVHIMFRYYSASDSEMTELKKQKLRLKEEIAYYEGLLAEQPDSSSDRKLAA